MLRFAEDLRVYLHREPVDFRCGINTLAALVENSMRSQYLIAAFYGDVADKLKPATPPHP
ncbi:IS66 family insertion sequence element accessory protein TnpB [Paraburkholderia graminis]|uniref:IS66 family insertion sequence element accessory protein TnpB n=1 Tax=Paraburkholderia graminis TaxID=60548 RepID=UPI0003F53A6C